VVAALLLLVVVVVQMIHCDNHDLLRVSALSSSSTSRRYCHGSAKIEGERTCLKAPNLGVQLAPNQVSIMYQHPYDRWFEIFPAQFLSSAGARLRRDESQLESNREIAIATQGTLDRIEMHLDRLARCWQGPMSVAVLVENAKELERARAVVRRSRAIQQWVDLHVVQRRGHTRGDPTAFYPINMLRNVAMQHVKTRWVFVLDIDLLPNACMSMYVGWVEVMEEVVPLQAGRSEHQHGDASSIASGCPGLLAFIPPALELTREDMSDLPVSPDEAFEQCEFLSKAQALECVYQGTLRPMHMYYPPAYIPTNYSRWISSNSWFEIPYSSRFEPYYIARSDVPLFNDSFVDRGRNFAQQVYHMWASGYRFYSIPSLFVIDIPHNSTMQAPFFANALQTWNEFKNFSSSFYGVEKLYSHGATLGNRLQTEVDFFTNLVKAKKVS